MSRSRLLDALDMALGSSRRTMIFATIRHRQSRQVVTAKPLSTQGIHHFRHFRHLNREKPAGDDRAQIDARSGDAVADNECAIEPEVYLLQE